MVGGIERDVGLDMWCDGLGMLPFGDRRTQQPSRIFIPRSQDCSAPAFAFSFLLLTLGSIHHRLSRPR